MEARDVNTALIWEQILSAMERERESIGAQLQMARKSTPRLAFAFEMVTQYAAFLEVRNDLLARTLNLPEEMYPHPRSFVDCRLTPEPCPGRPLPEILREALAWLPAEEKIDLDDVAESRLCQIVKSQLHAVGEKIAAMLVQDRRSPEERDELRRLLQSALTLSQRLEELGCVARGGKREPSVRESP